MSQWPDTRLWARWVAANSLGELLGLGATFAIGVGLFAGRSDVPGLGPALASAALMTATGALEGSIVGRAQWSVLRSAIAGISRRSWILATIAWGVVAWFFGSIPMTMASLSTDTGAAPAAEPPQAVVLLLAAGMGLVAGLILSGAQWAVLRRHVRKAWQWLPASALAWAAGMPLIFAGVDLAHRAGSVPRAVLVMAVAIALAGAVVGAIHGVALLSLAGGGQETRPERSG